MVRDSFDFDNRRDSKTGLGLSKKISDKAKSKDTIDNVSIIQFEDPEVERICHAHGVYTMSDASKVESIRDWFDTEDNRNIKSFDELAYFTSLSKIDNWDFGSCFNLEHIKLPDSITSIGHYAFDGCAFKSIEIPDSVQHIAYGAFECCTSLEDINIPYGITMLEAFTFANCDNLKTITIPDTVTHIGDSVFCGCISLSYIKIPNSVYKMSHNVFDECTSLNCIEISESCPVYSKIKAEYKDLVNNGINESSNLGLSKKISDSAKDNSAMDKINFIKFKDPEVERICHEHGVFTYEDARKVIDIESWFMYNTDVKTIEELKYFKNLKNMNKAFKGCLSLERAYVPKFVETALQAFRNCHSLKTVILEDGLKIIDEEMFYGCKTLEYLKIPSSVKTIERDFLGDTPCKSVNIPDQIEHIAFNAFSFSNIEQVIMSKTNHQGLEAFKSTAKLDPTIEIVYTKSPSEMSESGCINTLQSAQSPR